MRTERAYFHHFHLLRSRVVALRCTFVTHRPFATGTVNDIKRTANLHGSSHLMGIGIVSGQRKCS